MSEYSSRSFQQLDPVSAYSTRPVTILLSVCLVLYPIVEFALGRNAIVHPVLAVLAFIAAVVGAAGSIVYSSPQRGPFPRAAFIVIVVLMVAAMALQAGASWEGPTVPPGEWGAADVGLVIVQLSHYRPARELAAATVFGTVAAGCLVVLHPATGLSTSPVIVTVIETVIPLLALGLGAASYAAALTRSLARIRSRSDLAVRMVSDALRDHIVRSVQLDRVGILNEHVIPFFTEIVKSNQITAADRSRAAEISESVRTRMVADVDRTWLDALVDQLGEGHGAANIGSESVQDPLHLAVAMSTEQRVVMRVLLVTLFTQPRFDPDGFGIVMTRSGERCDVTVTARSEGDEPAQRSGLGECLAVLRTAFDDLDVSLDSSTLALRFGYEYT